MPRLKTITTYKVRIKKLNRPRYLKPTNSKGMFNASIINPIGHAVNLLMMMAAPETPPGAISHGAKNKFTLTAEIKLPAVSRKKPRTVEGQSNSFVSDAIFFFMFCFVAPGLLHALPAR